MKTTLFIKAMFKMLVDPRTVTDPRTAQEKNKKIQPIWKK